jgi:Na+-transporting NADH:ubiquinone oxidoreductase subunit C
MRGSLYTLAYAAVLGAVCALLLTGAGQLTAPYREANAKAEQIRNILSVLDVPFGRSTSSQDLLKLFEKNVRREERAGLAWYAYVEAGRGQQVRARAFPFAGSGVWGPVKGFLSLEPDMRTIHGITFYQQEETPGLGGEIASAWFREQFKGKFIEDDAGNPGIRILRGREASASNEVDGISGATMTCTRVEAILNGVIERIVEERDRHGR